ncbi:MAG TPA: hypothetical protein VJ698_02045 [Noviherbaspirillum sp.]|uniref:hypothetical protein n=1 Tax=Noviherbaspirillum sp. TaxID=1926288 RepID=UPI002B488E90|nr:hypothetical protein [Noviherbaspirillum sp.]HJV84231.1 hypothetical protein [Noviherbaspirillum sp.]
MKAIFSILAVAAMMPSIAAAQWYGSSFGKTIVDTGNQDVSVRTHRMTAPLIVGIANNSPNAVRCSASFSHLPVIDETESATIAPGKTVTLVNRHGYPTARIDTKVTCTKAA